MMFTRWLVVPGGSNANKIVITLQYYKSQNDLFLTDSIF